MKDIVIVMDGPRVTDVYSDDARGYVVVDGNAKDGGPYTYHYAGRGLDSIPAWAAHRLRLPAPREFQVGDRVRLVKRTEVDRPRPNRGPAVGALGTIRIVRMDACLPYGVEFDDLVEEGHGLGGTAVKWKHGWCCCAENLELVETERGMMLSKARELWYIQRNGDLCLGCESKAIAVESFAQVDDHSVWEGVRCLACGATWRDVYTLTGVDNFQKGDE